MFVVGLFFVSLVVVAAFLLSISSCGTKGDAKSAPAPGSTQPNPDDMEGGSSVKPQPGGNEPPVPEEPVGSPPDEPEAAAGTAPGNGNPGKPQSPIDTTSNDKAKLVRV
ncbi:hypothetical protein LBMAG48_09230 [Phycisphaerae bacterium]|nr:hypothetical protein LBMAG48_09230 [Phycisphaerae bacterium]